MACDGPFARGTGSCCCKCCPPPSCDNIIYTFQFVKNTCSSSSSTGPCLCNCCTDETGMSYYNSYSVSITGVTNNPDIAPITCCCDALNGSYILHNRALDGCSICTYTTNENAECINDPCSATAFSCPTDPSYPKWFFFPCGGLGKATLQTSQFGGGCQALSADADATGCESTLVLNWVMSPPFPCTACIASGTVTVHGVGDRIHCEGLPMSPMMKTFVKELQSTGVPYIPMY